MGSIPQLFKIICNPLHCYLGLVFGRDLFINHARSHCATCHGFNGGTDQNLDLPGEYGRIQAIKNPPLRLTYQKASIFNPVNGQQSLSGFGFGSDGTMHLLPKERDKLILREVRCLAHSRLACWPSSACRAGFG